MAAKSTDSAQKLSPLQVASLMGLFFTAMGVAAISPAMAKLAERFTGYDYALISTLPTLFIVPTTLWAGSAAGKRVRYKTLSTMGILLFLVGGLTPFFLTESFYVLLACRAVFGIGVGLRASLGNALVIAWYSGKRQADMLGYGTLVTNLGGILFQLAGGALAEVAWNYTFLAYLFGVLSLLLVFFQPEPPEERAPLPGEESTRPEPEGATEEGRGFWRPILLAAGLLFLYQLLTYPIMMNMSLLFEDKGAGGASAAALALSLYTAGGCGVGFLFGKVFHRLGRFTLVLGCLLAALGGWGLCLGASAFLMTCSCVVMGMASSLLTPGAYAIMGMYVPPGKSALCVSILMGVSNLGGFLCPFYLRLLTALFREALYSALYTATAAGLLLAAVFLLWDPLPRAKAGERSKH